MRWTTRLRNLGTVFAEGILVRISALNVSESSATDGRTALRNGKELANPRGASEPPNLSPGRRADELRGSPVHHSCSRCLTLLPYLLCEIPQLPPVDQIRQRSRLP